MRMSENTLFSDAAQVWLSVKQLEVKGNTYSESYERTVEKILLPRMERMTLGDIDRAFMAQMFSELSNIYSDSTLHKCQLAVEGIFHEAAYAGAALPPMPKIKVHSKIKFEKPPIYTPEQVAVVKDFAKKHRFGLSVLILMELGVRPGEMLALQWEDLNLENRIASITKSCSCINGKGVIGSPKSESSVRDIPMSKDFCDYLEFYCKGQRGYIINTGAKLMTSANYSKNRYNKFFEDLQRETGIARISPKQLRHTCATLLYNKTGDIYAVSKFLGHSTISITAKYYVHSDVESLRERLQI